MLFYTVFKFRTPLRMADISLYVLKRVLVQAKRHMLRLLNRNFSFLTVSCSSEMLYRGNVRNRRCASKKCVT